MEPKDALELANSLVLVLEKILPYMANDDRIGVWNALRAPYCHYCGCDNPHCQCSNDE